MNRGMRDTFSFDLRDDNLTYEGLAALTIGEQPPVETWARIYIGHPDLEFMSLPGPVVSIRSTPSVVFRVHIAPERPDLPDELQPPTWPPPFPADAPPRGVPYCQVAVTADGLTERIQRLRLISLESSMQQDRELTWDALLEVTA